MSSLSAQHRLVPARFLKGTWKDRRVTQKRKSEPSFEYAPAGSIRSVLQQAFECTRAHQSDVEGAAIRGAVKKKKKKDREERERERERARESEGPAGQSIQLKVGNSAGWLSADRCAPKKNERERGNTTQLDCFLSFFPSYSIFYL